MERVLVEEATRAAGEVAGLLGEPAPTARLIPGFGDFSLDFSLSCHVASYTDQFLVQHELRKRILRRLAAEGIQIQVQVRAAETRSSGIDPEPRKVHRARRGRPGDGVPAFDLGARA